MSASHIDNNGDSTKINRMLSAYPANIPCEISTDGHQETGTLISINANYARVACDAVQWLENIPYDSVLTLKTELKAGSCCLHSVNCVVTWKHGRELGLEFVSGAKVGLVELQDEFNGNHKEPSPTVKRELGKVEKRMRGRCAPSYAASRAANREEQLPGL